MRGGVHTFQPIATASEHVVRVYMAGNAVCARWTDQQVEGVREKIRQVGDAIGALPQVYYRCRDEFGGQEIHDKGNEANTATVIRCGRMRAGTMYVYGKPERHRTSIQTF